MVNASASNFDERANALGPNYYNNIYCDQKGGSSLL